jgi:hypothetical protein
MHARLRERGVPICERTVTHLLDRYDELVAVSLLNPARLRRVTEEHGRVILALDGIQPDVGHEVLWVLRDCLSGEVLLARSLLSASEDDLATLLREVRDAVEVPIVAVVSDGQQSIRKAVAQVLPKVPHQLCHFHYLREAAKPVFEADRHAKKELKKRVRGIRPMERAVEGQTDAARPGSWPAWRLASARARWRIWCSTILWPGDSCAAPSASVSRSAPRASASAATRTPTSPNWRTWLSSRVYRPRKKRCYLTQPRLRANDSHLLHMGDIIQDAPLRSPHRRRNA